MFALVMQRTAQLPLPRIARLLWRYTAGHDVAKAARVLDAEAPLWATRVQTHALDLNDSNACILYYALGEWGYHNHAPRLRQTYKLRPGVFACNFPYLAQWKNEVALRVQHG